MAEPLGFQVVVDCADPHAQARFWAAALHWDVEDVDAFARQMIEAGHATQSDVVEIDGKAYWATMSAIRSSGPGQRMLFQHVPEAKTVKNRWHVDVNVGFEAMVAEADRLAGLGATFVQRFDRPEGRWMAMLDPEGNEFCVH